MTTRMDIISETSLGHIPLKDEPVTSEPSSQYLRVHFGQHTFDAEGSEQPGPYFSRRISWPGGPSSGVTIGRGYDMGFRTGLQIIRDLVRAGVPYADATVLSKAAGLRGRDAEAFARIHKPFSPIISLQAQQRLFEQIATPEILADLKRISSKPETVAAYGAVQWDALPTDVQEVVFDLRYRGDYTALTRQRLQPILVKQDWRALTELMNDSLYWKSLNVPLERIDLRARLSSQIPYGPTLQ